MNQRVAALTWIPLRSIQATRSVATEYLPSLWSFATRNGCSKAIQALDQAFERLVADARLAA